MKYRVWDTITESYGGGDLWKIEASGTLLFGSAEWPEGIVELWTGLCDKDGTEIYVGSRVESITYGYLGEVKYVPENAAFLVFWSDDNGRHTDYLDEGICSRIKVVGTVHDRAGE